MNRKTKLLSVRLNGSPIGRLEQIKDGKMRFEYEADSRQISIQFPLDRNRYGNALCEIYFGGLLPESEEARRAIGEKFDVNPNSTFGLLRAIGRDCAGAISFHEPDEPVVLDKFRPVKVAALSDAELAKHIKELPRKPMFLGLDDLRLSLAGVQEKAAVCLLNDQIALPIEGTPTTHILKPSIDRFPGSVQNEYLCLRTAARIKLPVPAVQVRRAEDALYLLVERYDRKFDQQNQILRLHQEDFCQALGFREKYQRRGGPGLSDCFKLLMSTAIPIIDRRLLMQAVIFNFLIGNTDAHGKNFSILYDDGCVSKLAPSYDILCTQAYDGHTWDMSMKVGGRYLLSDVTLADWEELCKTTGFSFSETKKIILNQTNDVLIAVKEERDQIKGTEFNHEIIDMIVLQVERNCKRLEGLL